jgi:hypothetical protein
VSSSVTWTPAAVQHTYTPSILLAATSSDTLFVGKDSGSDEEVFLQHGVTDGSSAPTPRGIASFTGPLSATISGEVSPNNGYAAFTVPGAGGNLQVDYSADHGAASALTIAAPGGSVDGQTIDSILAGDAAPVMINDNGVTAFSADIGPDDNEALLAWSAAGGLKIVAEIGDPVDGVNGSSLGTIAAFDDNSLGTDLGTNLYNDGLSDANRLAFGVVYDTGTQDGSGDEILGSAVVSAVVTVPEPASLLTLTTLTPLILLRRRRAVRC